MTLILPVPNPDKINLDLPTYTLDINVIPVKPPDKRSTELHGIGCFEWNYFKNNAVELCVTPEASVEIKQNIPVNELGWTAYQRYLKSDLYKMRPSEATLELTQLEANELWINIRENLWDTVSDQKLKPNQIADVTEIYWHTVSSGSTASNSAYLTLDDNYIRRASEFYARYGVSIMTPNEAWEKHQGLYSLYVPTSIQVHKIWEHQKEHFVTIYNRSC